MPESSPCSSSASARCPPPPRRPRLTISGEHLENLAGAYDDLAGATSTVDPGQTTGWTIQAAFGEARKKGQWQLAYQYKYLEADATWDAISDSDFGLGGTDRRGHAIKLAYQLFDWWQLGLNAGLTEKISHRLNGGHNTPGHHGEDLLRLQADSLFRS